MFKNNAYFDSITCKELPKIGNPMQDWYDSVQEINRWGELCP